MYISRHFVTPFTHITLVIVKVVVSTTTTTTTATTDSAFAVIFALSSSVQVVPTAKLPPNAAIESSFVCSAHVALRVGIDSRKHLSCIENPTALTEYCLFMRSAGAVQRGLQQRACTDS
uniref:Secreted protein n=1 Tax=Lygus hesperus TaxID=30085 RepID=A0A0A9WDI7_LYGHE